MPEPLTAEALEAAFIRSRDMHGSLAERLQAFADVVREASPTFADEVDRLVERLELTGIGENSPAPGEPMPDFVLPDQHGQLVHLESLLKEGPVAVVFQRGHWCPYCRINTDALGKAQAEIHARGGQIISIVPNLQQFAAALGEDAKQQIPILVDMDNGYALSLNLAFWVPDEKRRMMIAAGWDIAPYQGNQSWMLPIPATFVVGTDGKVKVRHIDPDYRKRMATEDLVAAFDSQQ